MAAKQPQPGVDVAGDQFAATADNETNNQPEPVAPVEAEHRTIELSASVRDRLAELSNWLKAHRLRDEHTGDGAYAADEIVARYDAAAPGDVKTETSALRLEHEDTPAETAEGEPA